MKKIDPIKRISSLIKQVFGKNPDFTLVIKNGEIIDWRAGEEIISIVTNKDNTQIEVSYYENAIAADNGDELDGINLDISHPDDLLKLIQFFKKNFMWVPKIDLSETLIKKQTFVDFLREVR